MKTDFPPFGDRDPAGEIQGFDADLARYLGRALFEGEPGVELVPVTSGGRISPKDRAAAVTLSNKQTR